MVSEKMRHNGAHRSCIRELFEFGLERAKEVGAENVFDFSIGNPSTPAPKEVEAAIRQLLDSVDPVKLNGYTCAAGDPQCRQRVVDYVNSFTHRAYKVNDLFFTCGAAPAVISCMRALTINHDSEFIVIAPYFPEYRAYCEPHGGKVISIRPDIPNFQIDFDALADSINPNTQAVIVNSPNNPTGLIYSGDTLTQLGKLLSERSAAYGHPIYIIADEPYRELVYDGLSVPWIPDYYRDTLVCYSYSKALSLPGQRIGWVLFSDELTENRDIRDAVAGSARGIGHVCAPVLYQHVAATCANVRPDLSTYQRNRDILYEGLTRIGYECTKPQGAFYLFMRAPKDDGCAFSEKAKQQGLLIVPGRDMGCPSYVRISFCVPTERIERSLQLFEKLKG